MVLWRCSVGESAEQVRGRGALSLLLLARRWDSEPDLLDIVGGAFRGAENCLGVLFVRFPFN